MSNTTHTPKHKAPRTLTVRLLDLANQNVPANGKHTKAVA